MAQQQTVTQAKIQESFSFQTMISDLREPLIVQSQKDAVYLDACDRAKLELLTDIYEKTNKRIKELLGDESHD
ncbi:MULTISPECIES: hypothetical protein [Furfurilactobacillus]|nr:MULTISPECIES: hypothetical protein [Furfurilactobacillus]MCF6161969.1 hypothetical protein [Furfurilactobacillus milii]MCF6164349.1 hypothetical protein [Furfurilactobacillus milii]MDF9914837.1 hypothetical protein [Furfurilactobacillus milii]QFR66459.1 hypothetical protein LR814_04840 [Furfurilactobacillus rossiae]